MRSPSLSQTESLLSLEIVLSEPLQWAEQITTAGAIFCGPYTPEAVGDYIAGPNHVLPTNGTARFFLHWESTTSPSD